MERMSPADAAFLHLEDDLSAMHNVTLAVFAGPEPDFDELVERVRGRVGLVPRSSQRLLEVPFRLERPVWVDDPHFSVHYHVRHTALAPGDTDRALSALMGRVLSQRLDRTKPLWELWVVSGLPDGRWALLSKMHFAAIDGVSGTDVLPLLADDLHVGDLIPPPRSEAVPSGATLLARGVADLLLDPVERFRAARRVVTTPRRLAGQLRAQFVPQVVAGPLRGPIGPHRRWSPARLPLSELRAARQVHGGTTNDIVLACMTAGLRHHLVSHDIHPTTAATALVPVALTPGGAAFANQMQALHVDLPVHLADPLERLQAISAATARTIGAAAAVPGDVLRSLPSLTTATLCALGVRAAVRTVVKQGGADTVIVNVPGVDHDVEVLGRPLVEMFPVPPLAAGVRVSMGAISHGPTVFVGLTGDWDSMAELPDVAAAVEAGLAELS
jgi:WS/DGAT/MGAT family acyltransferase